MRHGNIPSASLRPPQQANWASPPGRRVGEQLLISAAKSPHLGKKHRSLILGVSERLQTKILRDSRRYLFSSLLLPPLEKSKLINCF